MNTVLWGSGELFQKRIGLPGPVTSRIPAKSYAPATRFFRCRIHHHQSGNYTIHTARVLFRISDEGEILLYFLNYAVGIRILTEQNKMKNQTSLSSGQSYSYAKRSTRTSHMLIWMVEVERSRPRCHQGKCRTLRVGDITRKINLVPEDWAKTT